MEVTSWFAQFHPRIFHNSQPSCRGCLQQWHFVFWSVFIEICSIIILWNTPLTVIIEVPAVSLGWLQLLVAGHQETKALLVMKSKRNVPFAQLDHVIHRLTNVSFLPPLWQTKTIKFWNRKNALLTPFERLFEVTKHCCIMIAWNTPGMH